MSTYSWRRICGFESTCEVPSEATLSRALADFSKDTAIASIQNGVLRGYVKGTKTLILNVNYDSTEIVAKEKGVQKEKKADAKARRTVELSPAPCFPPPSMHDSQAAMPPPDANEQSEYIRQPVQRHGRRV